MKCGKTVIFMTDASPFLVLHIGKTAGTAFKGGYLAEHYPADRVLIDLSTADQLFQAQNKLAAMPQEVRNQLKFVHGHALKGVVEYFDSPRFLTFLRDPVSIVVSQYYHHKFAVLEEGGEENTAIRQEGLGILEAAERFHYFNSQIRAIADLFNIDPKTLDETSVPNLLDRFEVVGITAKMQPFIYLMHKRYGCVLAPVEQRNSRSELVNQFTPRAVIDEIRARSSLDSALYALAEHRFDAQFQDVLDDTPDVDPAWNTFRSSVAEVHAKRLNENAEVVEQMNTFRSEIDFVVGEIEKANRIIQQKDQEIIQLRRQLGTRNPF